MNIINEIINRIDKRQNSKLGITFIAILISVLILSMTNTTSADYRSHSGPADVAIMVNNSYGDNYINWAKIQPLLIPANRVNPNTPLYTSQDNTGKIYIYKLPGTDPAVLVFQSSGAIDCDGQTTTQCNINTDPWYQPETSFTQSDGKFLNAAVLPYYVLPVAGSKYFDYTKHNIDGGQLGLIMYGNKMNYGVFGDENGDAQSIGEISYAMASSLGIDPDPHYGGVSGGVTFIIFTGTSNVVSPIEDHFLAESIGKVAITKLNSQLG